jgi:CRP-like cAMP-binding protein
LNPELSKRLDSIAVRAFLPRGAVLFHDGDPVSAVYVIRKGSLNLEWASYRMAFHQSLGPGQIAGLAAALNGTYNLTATAAEDCEVGYVPTAAFVQLLECEALRFPNGHGTSEPGTAAHTRSCRLLSISGDAAGAKDDQWPHGTGMSV